MASSLIGASGALNTTSPTSTPSGTETTTQVPGKTESQLPPKPYYKFDVKMTCSGCSGAIDRVLKKNITSPNEYSVSLQDQTVFVWGPAASLPPFDDVKAKIAKTGKEILGTKEEKA
ncbi:hypothetical protein NliqN6_1445 [Naganishia liquefaciens]|uniref:HMA domain-containing protein n=1 Tax=Naganishia liquefaciens TaxID=104408 RepID=A0A8H3YDA9_9TREE|nr:hypothetical protein NliqN6_1445 [Naganishia liquefaciens]